VAAGCDALGFLLTESPRQITADQARCLVESAGSTLTVAVFRGEPMTVVLDLARRAGVAAVQLHGDYRASDIAAATDAGLVVLRAVTSGGPTPPECGAFGEDFLVVDSTEAGSGLPWDWSAPPRQPGGRWLLAGGLTARNVGEAMRLLRPWGVDVSSGVERDRGVKDPDLITEFVTVAKSLDSRTSRAGAVDNF
jgi:phosphoribosylanthranilate isomerase